MGVDLGTTNSCVAVAEAGGARVVRVGGARTVPSVVAWPEAGARGAGAGGAGRPVVGAAAAALRGRVPGLVLPSAKRLLGRGAAEAAAAAPFLPQEIVPAEGVGARGESAEGCAVRLPGGGEVSPEEALAAILAELVAAAEADPWAAGERVSRAVVGVPAHFTRAQRAAVERAGAQAGLEAVRLIREPVAAAVAYGLDCGREELVLVYDLGGGTFDVALLEVGGDTIEVRATGGDPALGGDDFDAAVGEWLEREGLRDHRQALLSVPEDARNTLLAACARALREDLSDATEASLEVPLRGAGAVPVRLTRQKFEKIAEPLLRRSWMPVNQVCWQGGVELFSTDGGGGGGKGQGSRRRRSSKGRAGGPEGGGSSGGGDRVDRVLLVGGATRMPAVRRFVRNMTGLEPELAAVDPDEAVALGAAIEAGRLQGEMEGVVVLDKWQAALARALAEQQGLDE